LILLGTPLAFAIVTTLHPTTGAGPGDLSLPLARWQTVHGLQVILTVLLAYCIWILLDGIRNRAATTARFALPAFLALFGAAFLWDRRRTKTGAGSADSPGPEALP
jgi:hypothetical protein